MAVHRALAHGGGPAQFPPSRPKPGNNQERRRPSTLGSASQSPLGFADATVGTEAGIWKRTRQGPQPLFRLPARPEEFGEIEARMSSRLHHLRRVAIPGVKGKEPSRWLSSDRRDGPG